MKNKSLIDLKLAKKLYDEFAKVWNPDEQLSLTVNVLGHDVEYIFDLYHPFNADGDWSCGNFIYLEFSEYKASKEANKFFDSLFDYSFDIAGGGAVHTAQLKLEKNLKGLYKAEEKINKHLQDIKISQKAFCACFKTLSKNTLLPWVTVSAALSNLSAAPKPIEVKLNGSYTAEIVPNNTTIQVGCLSIPIAKIREVLATYDKISNN
jgi:hypothetical protein